MNLGDRRGGERRLGELGEHRFEGRAEVFFDGPTHHGERLRWHAVAELAELRDEFTGEDPLAGADDLAHLDVGRSELAEGDPQPPRDPGPADLATLGLLLQAPHAEGGAEDVGGAQ